MLLPGLSSACRRRTSCGPKSGICRERSFGYFNKSGTSTRPWTRVNAPRQTADATLSDGALGSGYGILTGMGAKTLVSESEYLGTAFESPEPEFVDGEIIQRAMPDTFHSEAVDALTVILIRQAPMTLYRRPELRIQVAPGRYRVVDLAVFDRRPVQRVPELTPLIAIEVLSPDDSHAELMRKFADYASLGIPHIWLVDPIARRLSIYHDESLEAVRQFEVPAHGLVVRPSDLFPAP